MLRNFQQSVAHLDGAVGDTCQAFVVGNYDEGLSVFLAQVEEQLVQFFLVLRVQRTTRFVSQNDCRIVHQRTGYGDALLLTTAEFVGLMLGTVCQPHKLQQFLGSFAGSLLRRACYVGRNHDVLQCREFRQQLVELKHKANMLVTEVAQLFL